jgi:hypothetical protein
MNALASEMSIVHSVGQLYGRSDVLPGCHVQADALHRLCLAASNVWDVPVYFGSFDLIAITFHSH